MYIFVLAGGLDSKGRPHPFVKKRLDKAYDLFQMEKNRDQYVKDNFIILLGGGTYHKPPYLNNNNYVIHESSSCAKYLLDKGIPEEHMMREWGSYDTIANGFFAFLNFVQPLNIKECYVITSQFHMDRTRVIFDYFQNICYTDISIHYIQTENYQMEKKVLDIRDERERHSIMQFKKNILNNIKNKSDFTKWFYTQHNAYKAITDYYCDYKINDTY